MTITAFPLQAAGVTFGQEPYYTLLDHLVSEGVAAGLGVIQNPAGADMSVTVQAGTAYATVTSAGKRLFINSANSNSGPVGTPGADWLATFTTAHATLPRIDRIVATIQDNLVDGGSGQYRGMLKVVAGTATAAADLDNLNGIAAIPDNSVLIRNVLVRAAATTILTADIDTVPIMSTIGGGVIKPRSAGHVGNAAESTAVTSTSYVSLDARDIVEGIVVPTGGILRVSYEALWRGTHATGVTLFGNVALFINGVQIQAMQPTAVPGVVDIAMNAGSTTSSGDSYVRSTPDSSCGIVTGTASAAAGTDASFVTTGMKLDSFEVSLAAGTYEVEVKYKAAAACSVFIKSRKLRVEAIGF